jgi:hypothetical protein
VPYALEWPPERALEMGESQLFAAASAPTSTALLAQHNPSPRDRGAVCSRGYRGCPRTA